MATNKNTNNAVTTTTTEAPAKKKTGRTKGSVVVRTPLPPIVTSETFQYNRSQVVFSIHESSEGKFRFSRQTKRIDGSAPKPELTEIPLNCLSALHDLLLDPSVGGIHEMNEFFMFADMKSDGAFNIVCNPVRETEYKDQNKIPEYRPFGAVIPIYIPNAEVANWLAERCEEAKHDRALPAGSSDDIAQLKAEKEAASDVADVEVQSEEVDSEDLDQEELAAA